MKEKKVCFAGHRYIWQNSGVEDKLKEILIKVINDGYTTFYCSNMGYFDKLCIDTLFNLKAIYKHIKIFKILTYYHENKEKWDISKSYSGSLMPEIEQYYPKARITKKNEWLVDSCDLLICHIIETYKSGAYNTVKYAIKKNKDIIYV